MGRVKWYGNEIIKNVKKAREHGVREATEFILDESNKRVPHDEGTLQDSGIAQVSQGGKEAVVSYNTPYAVYQHEATHLNHPNGRESKYLENALKENKRQAQDHIEESIKQVFRG